MVCVRFSVLLLLVALTQSYIWTKKKNDDPEGPQRNEKLRRRSRPESKYIKRPVQPSVLKSGLDLSVEVFLNGDWNNGINVTLSATECASQLDLSQIIGPKVGIHVNCSLYTFYGIPVRNCADAMEPSASSDKATMRDLFIVPLGRFFMLPAKRVGDLLFFHHIDTADNTTVQLEVLSIEPRIFKISHFVSTSELAALTRGAKNGTRIPDDHDPSDPYVSAAAHSYSSAVDVTLSDTLKERLFSLLGMLPYQSQLSEEIQTRRHEVTGATAPHREYIDPLVHNKPLNNSTTNASTAVNIDDVPEFYYEGHDYGSATIGHNRYASLLLHMNTPRVGGETVFSAVNPVYDRGSSLTEEEFYSRREREAAAEREWAEPLETPLVEAAMAANGGDRGAVNMARIQSQLTAHSRQRMITKYLSQHNATHMFPPKTWENDLIGTCRARLSVPARKGEALLFYHQNPYGAEKKYMLHGSCPVIKGEKWTSLFHVWNGPHPGYWARNSITGEYVQKAHLQPDEVVYASFDEGVRSVGNSTRRANVGADGNTASDAVRSSSTATSATASTANPAALQEVSVSFECVDIDKAELYWEEQLWEVMAVGRVVKVNSFQGHRWHVVVRNVKVATWTVGPSLGNPAQPQTFVISYKALGIAPPVDREL